ncbi:hypothetical protein AAKU55_005548 [Oxalobacteraceae bacterium GrIS 1.11]
MQFSYDTIQSTSKQFIKALNARGLSLSLSAQRNLWTQIVLGKNHSAALSYARAHGYVDAIPITVESIRTKLKARSREIDYNSAHALIAEAIGNDLSELSYCMSKLVEFIRATKPSCLISIDSDRTGLGVMDTRKAGYIPVGNIPFCNGREREIVWLHSSSGLAAVIVNTLAGVSGKQSRDICSVSFRALWKKEDEVFAFYMGTRVMSCSRSIAEGILAVFDPVLITDCDVIDYDRVSDIVFDVIDAELNETPNQWLKSSCQLCEAMVNHVAARIRGDLKWLSEQANDGEVLDSPMEFLIYTAQLSIQKILNIQQE